MAPRNDKRDDRKSDRRKTREQKTIMGKQRNCPFCEEKSFYVDYHDVKRMSKFTSEQGRIMTRRTSGVCALHQRQLVKSIKLARHLAMLPFVSDMTR
jgi:small subunit ribosomal protein S18